MDVKRFEKKLKHLTQEEILTGAISSLNMLLFDKGITSEKELQKYFLEWLKYYKASSGCMPDKNPAAQAKCKYCK